MNDLEQLRMKIEDAFVNEIMTHLSKKEVVTLHEFMKTALPRQEGDTLMKSVLKSKGFTDEQLKGT